MREIIFDAGELAKLFRKLQHEPMLAVDVETTGLDWKRDVLEGVGIATNEDAWYIPLANATPKSNIMPSALAMQLGTLFNAPPDEAPRIVAHNAVFDLHFLRGIANGFLEFTNDVWDTMSLCRMMYDGLPMSDMGLKKLAKIILGFDMQSFKEGYANQDIETQANYCMDDVRATFELAAYFAGKLHRRVISGSNETLLDYYIQRVVPLHKAVLSMEELGWRLDVEKLRIARAHMMEEVDAAVNTLLENMEDWTGWRAESVVWDSKGEKLKVFNPNSYQQVAKALIRMGEELPLTSKGNPSTGADVLEELDNPLAESMLHYRQAKKFLDYLGKDEDAPGKNSLLYKMDADGRIRCNWNFVGTVTGRFSASGPNLQNIPRPDTTEGYDINPRAWFVADEGYKLIVADAKQAEVRALAALADAPALIEAVNSGEDMHATVAARIFGADFTGLEAGSHDWKDMRQQAKTAVFGTIYGQGPASAADKLGITINEAKEVINAFYRAFPGVREWMNRLEVFLSRHEYVEMLYGRRRSPVFMQIPPDEGPERILYNLEYKAELAKMRSKGLDDSPDSLRARAIRQAVNATVQGTVGEILNQWIVSLHAAGWRVIGQVHDEIILEVPEDEVEKAILDVRATFPSALESKDSRKKVKMGLDIAVGDDWACGKE